MTSAVQRFYIPTFRAADEFARRRALRSPTATDPLEAFLARGAYAVLFRQVASPTLELCRFASLATSCGLTPLVLEFLNDKFVTRNLIKYSLARMTFFGGVGRNGGRRLTHRSIVDLSAADGRRLEAVQTLWGQPLAAFHHELLSLSRPVVGVRRVDGSAWFNARGTSRSYYADFLSLFISHAVLFESFLSTPHERDFTDAVVIPAYREVASRGLPPLICPLDPPDREGCQSWHWYDHGLLDYVTAKLDVISP